MKVQLESAGMRRLAKDVKPEKSATSSQWLRYLDQDRWIFISHSFKVRLTKSVRYPHKDLKTSIGGNLRNTCLSRTGDEYCYHFGGFTMSEADLLRMAVGKRKKH